MKSIEVLGLKKYYGNVKAVDGVDFYVEPGSLFAFLGPNGAGKSTVIDILCTLSRPQAGQAFIKSDGLLWPLFYTGAFYLLFNGLLTVVFGSIEKKLDYFRG